MLDWEFNATLLAQIVDLIILVLFAAGIITVILKWSFKKSINNKIETMNSELKEIRRLLEEKKG